MALDPMGTTEILNLIFLPDGSIGSHAGHHQFAVEPVEVLVTFDQEPLNKVVQSSLPSQSE